MISDIVLSEDMIDAAPVFRIINDPIRSLVDFEFQLTPVQRTDYDYFKILTMDKKIGEYIEHHMMDNEIYAISNLSAADFYMRNCKMFNMPRQRKNIEHCILLNKEFMLEEELLFGLREEDLPHDIWMQEIAKAYDGIDTIY